MGKNKKKAPTDSNDPDTLKVSTNEVTCEE